ncbi:MAG TPA: alpha/beta fold hydrolase [Novosphingobium sp.]|nr:alpha/beta fold hydrolase [Novosphingobium sp.]
MMADFAFLHGGGQGGRVWAETIAAMQELGGEGMRCLALDAPGCGGKRGRDTSAIPFAAIAEELVAEVRAAGLRDVVLVGHSQAGMTMPDMARIAPGLFGRLVFLTCSAPPDGVTTIEQMGSGLHGSHPDQVGWPVDPATTTMAERYRAMFCNDMSDADAFLGRLGHDQWPPCCYNHRNWRRDPLAAMPVS